jgi:hypothetical protein
MGKSETKLELIDKIIISSMGVSALIAILLTVVWVNYKHSPNNKDNIYKEIEGNKTYTYTIESNKINLYKKKEMIDSYTCINNCKIKKNETDQFIIEYDSFISIYDNNKYLLYNPEIKATYYTFDTYPKITKNKNYGLVVKDNKYGIINKSGGLILNTEYDYIEATENNLVTLKNYVINVYDYSGKKITNDEYTNIKEIVVLEKEKTLYIYTTDINGNRNIIPFDLVTNKYA